MTAKDELHSLIDELPQRELATARRFLKYLRDCESYDDPLTPEEVAASNAAWHAYLEGTDPGETLKKVRQEL